jgi:hypothetical protein
MPNRMCWEAFRWRYFRCASSAKGGRSARPFRYHSPVLDAMVAALFERAESHDRRA